MYSMDKSSLQGNHDNWIVKLDYYKCLVGMELAGMMLQGRMFLVDKSHHLLSVHQWVFVHQLLIDNKILQYSYQLE